MSAENIDNVLDGYLTAAAWSSTHTEDNGDDAPLDSFRYPWSDAAKARARKDVGEWLGKHADLVEQWEHCGPTWDRFEDIGHNLWLSAHGHGTGFWDRGQGELGDRLHEAAKTLEETYPWVNHETKELEIE